MSRVTDRRLTNTQDGWDDADGTEMDLDQDGSNEEALDRQLAKKLVRYAISCEFSRTPIRRDGIKERVLAQHGRAFKRVLALAQQQLKLTMGMELRELPVKEKVTLREKRQAIKSGASQKVGSGTYVLSTVLPDAYRQAAIIAPSKAPSAESEAIYTAFCTTVVSIIWLHGGEISDQKLQRFLVRLNADQNLANEKTELVLKRMDRQLYVSRSVDTSGHDGEQAVSWTVGPRGKEEIGLDGVAGLIRAVYGEMTPELEKRLEASLGLNKNNGVAAGAPNEQDDEEGDESQMNETTLNG